MEISPAARERIAAHGVRVGTAPDAANDKAETIVLAVKPQDARAALASVAGSVHGKLVISIAAGVRLAALSRWLGGHRRIVRCMPNTPALVGAGISGLFAPAEVSPQDRKNVTSKGGTTEAALNVFEREQLAERFARALAAATRRGHELGDELAKD